MNPTEAENPQEREDREHREVQNSQEVVPSDYRAGYVAIVGEPNVGKSTLLNQLLGARLSIVTRKPQTTRKSVLGIYSDDTAQIIFIDTPGVLTPKYLLQEKLAGYIADALRDADVILLMLDVNNPAIERLAQTPLGNVQDLGKPVVLMLTKMDLLKNKKEALPLIERFTAMGVFEEVVPASAMYGQNTAGLLEAIRKYIPYGRPFYDPELLSEQPQRFFVSELIREQIMLNYRQEIPYAVEVNIVEFIERPEPEKLYIHAEIIVERESQKGILIGKKGESLKWIGLKSRTSIEEFLDREVFLELFVKVRKDWRSDERRLRGFGY